MKSNFLMSIHILKKFDLSQMEKKLSNNNYRNVSYQNAET